MKKYKWRLYADNNIEKEIVDHLRERAKTDVLWVRDHPNLQREQDNRRAVIPRRDQNQADVGEHHDKND